MSMQVPKKKKTIVEKYETLWNGGKSVTAQYPKIGYCITLYCVTKMNEEVSKTPNLPKEERDQIIAKVKELMEYKATLPKEYLDCTLEEYQDFLQTFFEGLDYEDRKKTVTMKTVTKFRMMVAFVDVLQKFGPMEDSMKQLKKYCTWKAVDISKSLRKGEIPHRGGPKENIEEPSKKEEDLLGKEIDNMTGNSMDQNMNQFGNFNSGLNQNIPQQNPQSNPFNNQGNIGGSLNNPFQQKNPQQNPFGGNSGQMNFNNPYNNQNAMPQQPKSQQGMNNPFQQNSMGNNPNSNQQFNDPFGGKGPQNPYAKTNSTGNQGPNTQNRNIPQPHQNQSMPHQGQNQGQFRPQNNPQRPQNNPQPQPQKTNIQSSQPVQHKPINYSAYDMRDFSEDTLKNKDKIFEMIELLKERNKMVYGKDTGPLKPAGPRTQKVTRGSNGKALFSFPNDQKMEIGIPVKYKGIDYYGMIQLVKRNNSEALKMFKKHRMDYTLNMIEDSLEYLSYIQK
ncbi:MAG: hypothetical protein MJ252_22665 [archaeon]|nr:hypothetical protein [archaeon]